MESPRKMRSTGPCLTRSRIWAWRFLAAGVGNCTGRADGPGLADWARAEVTTRAAQAAANKPHRARGAIRPGMWAPLVPALRGEQRKGGVGGTSAKRLPLELTSVTETGGQGNRVETTEHTEGYGRKTEEERRISPPSPLRSSFRVFRGDPSSSLLRVD